MESVNVVIFAGGIGVRMSSTAVPKQFLELYGKPIIVWTLEHFQNHPEVSKIVVVCVQNWISKMEELITQFKLTKVVSVVPGGSTGQDSIYNGLCKLEALGVNPESLIMIHDGVRPLISEDAITKNIETAKIKGNAVTCSPLVESVVVMNSEGDVENVADRSKCLVARAPQTFKLEVLLKLHREAIAVGKHDFIDTVSMVKAARLDVYTALGPFENIKITTPQDFYLFKVLLENKESMRTWNL